MLLAILCLLTALTISGVAIYYSVIGLTAIFAAAAIPIMIMGVALEVAKLVATVWLHRNWKSSPVLIKTYLSISVLVLMLITSMGIFGFLSKAHNDQTLVSGDVLSKIAIYDEKIKTEKENIEANRKALKQMDEGVDQVLGRSKDEKGADKAVALRKSQQKERTRIQNEILQSQKSIAELSNARAPIAAEVRKVEAEVGPIKYIAAFFYGNTDGNILERAVTWVIMTIIFVFDPLAVVLLLASQYSFREYFHNKKDSKMKDFFEHIEPTEPAKPTTIPEEFFNPENHVTSPPVDLDEVKEKLNKFNEALVENQKVELPTFAKMDTTIKGFDVPKVNVSQEAQGIVPINLNTEAVELPETEIPIKDLDAWNKMIEAAEKEIANSDITPEEEKILSSIPEPEVEKNQNGLNDPRDLSHPKYETYIQNEEQNVSNLWQETVSSLSQTDYQEKAKEASYRELVRLLDAGEIKIEDLTEEETKGIEEYLKKENNDRQDNTDKSA